MWYSGYKSGLEAWRSKYNSSLSWGDLGVTLGQLLFLNPIYLPVLLLQEHKGQKLLIFLDKKVDINVVNQCLYLKKSVNIKIGCKDGHLTEGIWAMICHI